MVSVLSLRSLLTHPDIASEDIEFNWAALGSWGAEVKAALEAGAVYITDLTIDENGMTLTLSNGNLVGPAPLQVTMPRPMGDWAEGVSYKKADFIKGPDGLLIGQIAHVSSADLAADIADGKLAYYASNGEDGGGGGGGGSGDIYLNVSNPAMLVSYESTIGMVMVPVACTGAQIRAVMRVVPSSIDVEVSLYNAAGSNSLLDTITFGPGAGENDQTLDLGDTEFDAGDIIVFENAGHSGSSAGMFVISIRLTPAA